MRRKESVKLERPREWLYQKRSPSRRCGRSLLEDLLSIFAFDERPGRRDDGTRERMVSSAKRSRRVFVSDLYQKTAISKIEIETAYKRTRRQSETRGLTFSKQQRSMFLLERSSSSSLDSSSSRSELSSFSLERSGEEVPGRVEVARIGDCGVRRLERKECRRGEEAKRGRRREG